MLDSSVQGVYSLLELIQLYTNAGVQRMTDKCRSSEVGDIYLELGRIRK